jgi:hypothetical protein
MSPINLVGYLILSVPFICVGAFVVMIGGLQMLEIIGGLTCAIFGLVVIGVSLAVR